MADEASVQPPDQNYFLTRELDQAYLLLDHITMSETKFLPPANAPGGDVVAQISAIRYPPQGTAPELAVQAATLMHAVDTLNRAATPANGLTIAFTLLVAGEDEAIRERSTTSGPSQAPNRLALAVGAFPTLVGPARRFKWFYASMITGLILLFIITLLLSWYVATGMTLLGQLNAGENAWRDVSKQITAAQLAEYSKGPPPTAGSPASAAAARYCPKFTNGPVMGASVEALDSTTGLPLCDRNNWLIGQVQSARENLIGWFKAGPLWDHQSAGQKQKAKCENQKSDPTCLGKSALFAGDVDEEQWVAALFQILGGVILPIFYGMLGAGAAVVRTISAKIRESVLAPRDRMLAIIQLVLGAVIGGCIGLFITPGGAGTNAEPGLLGAVQLSASALCFVAGFGVDSVFAALELMIRRVFNVSDPARTPAPSPAPPQPA